MRFQLLARSLQPVFTIKYSDFKVGSTGDPLGFGSRYVKVLDLLDHHTHAMRQPLTDAKATIALSANG